MASIRKRTLPSGKAVWLVDYRDQAGQRRAKQFPTRKAADAWSVHARGQVAAGTHVADSSSVTVKAAAALWIERCEADGLETSTIRQYRGHVDNRIVPRIGAEKLSRLTVPRLEALKDEMLRDLSRALTRKVMVSISSIITEAQRRGLVAQNVARTVRVRAGKREKPRLEMPTKLELKAMITHAEGRFRSLLLTAIYTGLRSSEIRGLRWSDVDLKAGVLQVRQRADQWGAIGAPKSEAGFRSLPMPPSLVAALREWQLICPRIVDPVRPVVDDDGKPKRTKLDLVFPNGAGKPESHANLLNREFWPLQLRAGVTVAVIADDGMPALDDDGRPLLDAKYSLHALRHAAAALFIEEGLSPKRVQTLLGHATIAMTFDVYGYLFEQRDQDAVHASNIEARLNG